MVGHCHCRAVWGAGQRVASALLWSAGGRLPRDVFAGRLACCHRAGRLSWTPGL